MHPLIVPSSMPYSLPPFAEVDDTAYLPAFEYAMEEHRREIDALVAQDGPKRERAHTADTLPGVDGFPGNASTAGTVTG